ncbi:MAG: hypothetical protein NTX27_18210 [Verrucomicrobia bacterium]|nr:hypothetical protein [Verrucomicrobiota bacterium]
MNIRRKPSFPKYSLPNHQWMPADKVTPDADIIRHDAASGLVLVRDRSRKPWSWHFEAEPAARQRRKSTPTVAADARTAVEDLSWRIRHNKDGAAACELAALVSDAVDALWKHTKENPDLFKPYAHTRYTWPFKGSTRRGGFTDDEKKIIGAIELDKYGPPEDTCGQTFRGKDDEFLKIARDLIEAIEDARNGQATGMLAERRVGLGALSKKRNVEEWWEIAEAYLRDGYPDLAAIPEFASLVPDARTLRDKRKFLKDEIKARFRALSP